ncbi:hypothetical protein NIES4075_71360 [Tolypothrix sp. NIES-4075]|uniref:hypothetical protein n=1 Tax=Tolypothrix sp. NIES-4075 TaxID=2005459 RepID=UPI000B5C4C44|nr:hypothetical protein [Tolypothrix sp. NIES-4075]GAX46115.1 hypothetical protein NIES4075_71360 [Tolypothrix sp. NIES-4075]
MLQEADVLDAIASLVLFPHLSHTKLDIECRAITVAAALKKALILGANTDGLVISLTFHLLQN